MHKIIIAALALAVLSGCVSAAQQKREAAKERAEVVFQLGNECVQQHGLSKETDAHAACVRRLSIEAEYKALRANSGYGSSILKARDKIKKENRSAARLNWFIKSYVEPYAGSAQATGDANLRREAERNRRDAERYRHEAESLRREASRREDERRRLEIQRERAEKLAADDRAIDRAIAAREARRAEKDERYREEMREAGW
jgi:hypothetical protein